MTAPIRNVEELLAALRAAQIERGLSNAVLEHVSGLASGHVDKILGPPSHRSKGLGQMSLPLILFGLGKALVLVDDEKAIREAKQHWEDRIIKGGATLQMRRFAEQASRASMAEEVQETADFEAKQTIRERMKQLSKLGASKGGKRRAEVMKRRARQRVASHAARARWAKRNAQAS